MANLKLISLKVVQKASENPKTSDEMMIQIKGVRVLPPTYVEEGATHAIVENNTSFSNEALITVSKRFSGWWLHKAAWWVGSASGPTVSWKFQGTTVDRPGIYILTYQVTA